MTYIFLFLFILTISSVVSLSEKYFKFILFFPSIILVLVQVGSVYTISAPANEQVMNHMDWSTIRVAFDTMGYNIVLVFCGLIFVFIILTLVLSLLRFIPKFIILVSLVLCIFSHTYASFYLTPINYISENVSYLVSADNNSTTKEINEKYPWLEYTTKSQLVIKESNVNSYKNILVIYLESFENSYLINDNYRHGGIAKEILSIADRDDFMLYEKNFIDTDSYTISAIFSSQCGFPPRLGVAGNNLFKTISFSEILCLNNILSKAGYYSMFIGGDSADFAGRGELLKHMDYDFYSKENLPKEYERISWGVRDLDLLTTLKDVISNNKDRTFNIALTTLGPHHRNGFYDERCKDFSGDWKYEIEIMVSCNSYIVKEVVDFIENLDLLDKTNIYILPDHIAMNGVINIDELMINDNRHGWILTNDFSIENYNSFTNSNLTELIMSSSGVESNAKFISENFSDNNDFIHSIKNDGKLYSMLSEALTGRIDLRNGITVEKKQSGMSIYFGDVKRNFQTESVYFNVTDNYEIINEFNGLKLSNQDDKDSLKLFILLRPNEVLVKLGRFDDRGMFKFQGKLFHRAKLENSITSINLEQLIATNDSD